MTESANVNINSELIGPSPLLRDVLVSATFGSNRAVSSAVDLIDLGVFTDEARVLANECFLQEELNNLAKPVYVTGRKRVLIPKKAQLAPSNIDILMEAFVHDFPKDAALTKNLDARFISMIMHTSHNSDRLAHEALCLLLTPDNFLMSLSCVFIVGRSANTLIFRGENTPALSVDEANKKGQIWDAQLDQRVKKFVLPEMSMEERLGIVARAERTLVRQICNKYELKFFSGPTDSPIVKRQYL